MSTNKKMIEVLKLMAADMEQDASDFDGKPFNGKSVGEMHGNTCAAIAGLANILKEHLEACDDKTTTV